VPDRDALLEAILGRLSGVIDPETEVGVVRMRLIEHLTVDEAGIVGYKFRPSSPFCPLAVPLALSIREAVAEVDGVTRQAMSLFDRGPQVICRGRCDDVREDSTGNGRF
jgi:metal-sulfur cluster biosynthetic enzyme